MILKKLNRSKLKVIIFVSFILTYPLIGNCQFEILYKNFEILKKYGYKASLDSVLIDFAKIDKTKSIELNIGYQTLMSFYSFQNEKDSSLKYELLSAPYKQYDGLSDYSKLNTKDAKKHLLSLAETKKIIILNEKHNRSTSREFLASMLMELKEKGYSILALEDLAETHENLISRGYPIKNSGFYVVEYNYANLIRLAMNLGFELISYNAGKSKQRSKDSYTNINEYLSQKPNAKMIILGGYGYCYKETTTLNEAPRLGTLLNKEYSDSLLSVDCITFNNMFLKSYQSPLYNYLSDSMKINIPSVLYNYDTLIYPDRISKALIDFSVYFPKEFSFQPNKIQSKLRKKRKYLNMFYEVYLTNEFEKEANLSIPVYMNKLKGLTYEYPNVSGKYIILFYNKFGEVVLKTHKFVT
jgi:hypothetical protein